MIEQFITLLQQHGLAITGEEVADILWFATKLSTPIVGGEKSNAADGKRNSGFAESKPNQSQPMHHEPPDEHRKRPTTLQNQRQKIDVYLAPIDTSSDDNQTKPARSVRLPAAPALPGRLDISRSLRPLMRRVPSRTIFLLDETATAQHIADTDDWTPILYPEPRPWLDVVLVADESSSMTMWQHTIHELRRLLERHGAFRNIYLWGITPGPHGYGIHLHSGLGGTPNSNRSRDPRELFDHHGQRLILLISDCVAPAWHNGTLPTLLADWGQYGMTALVQMLPEPLWSRTGLRHFPAILTRANRPGTPNCQLFSEQLFQRLDQPLPVGLVVPVFTLDPTSISHWAHMLVGNPRVRVRSILLPFDLKAPTKNAVIVESSTVSLYPTLSVTELLHLFHTRASPSARRLAGFFAAFASLSLPVMRLVQHVMLPDSKQVDLAEVLLSGLIKRVNPSNHFDVSADQIEYQFVDNNVRERLRSTVRISEVDQACRLVEQLSAYVERHEGQIEDFHAWIEDWIGTSGNRIIQSQQMIAQIWPEILGVTDATQTMAVDRLPQTPNRSYAKKEKVPYISTIPDFLVYRHGKTSYRQDTGRWLDFAQKLADHSASTYAMKQIFEAAVSEWGQSSATLDKLERLYDDSGHKYSGLIKELVQQRLAIPFGILLREYIKQTKFQIYLRELAEKLELPVRDIELQLLLHLPRLLAVNRVPTDDEVFREIDHVSEIAVEKIQPYRAWQRPPVEQLTDLAQTEFAVISATDASIIHKHFHYIGSPRADSLHFGLRIADGRIATLISISAFDLPNLARGLPSEVQPREVRVLSRGFAFEWAPANHMSYLMAKVWKWFAEHQPQIKMFMTYVNPNLGFTGASYKASNWVYWGREGDVKYAYLDSRYITEQQIYQKFGTTDRQQIYSKVGNRFAESQIELAPLLLFVYFPSSEWRAKYNKGFDYDFEYLR